MDGLTLGVIGTSRKRDERRLGIHPAHFERIKPELRSRIYVEHGYGERFGVSDAELAPLVAGLRTREELVERAGVVLLPKPLAEDLEGFREGQVLWGWPHVVQDEAMAQAAIDRKLTLIAWEAMNHWTDDGAFSLHVFFKNNELAGYASVLHALSLRGSTGAYGRPLRAAVISFGATGRGAATALSALGVQDITVFTQRSATAVPSPVPTVVMRSFGRDPADERRAVTADDEQPLAEVLAGFDVVVNCILQDTDNPLLFVLDEELRHFSRGSLIVDVSCDPGMGFEWARGTSFADPVLEVGDGVTYYAVDHSPSYLWDSATWEISEALLPYLPVVLGGGAAWEADETVRRAIEIRDGVVVNPRVLSFQGRAAEYPHERLAGA